MIADAEGWILLQHTLVADLLIETTAPQQVRINEQLMLQLSTTLLNALIPLVMKM